MILGRISLQHIPKEDILTTNNLKSINSKASFNFDHGLSSNLHKEMPDEVAAMASFFHDHLTVINSTTTMYSTFQDAIKELTDNALDAGATHIDFNIFWDEDEQPILSMADNGKGMSPDVLKDLYFLVRNIGSAARNQGALGKNGMGAKGSLNSLAAKAQVYSFPEGFGDSQLIYGRNFGGKISGDMPVCRICKYGDEGLFEVTSKIWDEFCKERKGTLVLARDLHPRHRKDFSKKNAKKVISSYKEDIGLTYGHFINQGVKFTVNDQVIEAISITEGGERLKKLDKTFNISDPDNSEPPGLLKLSAYEHESPPSHNKIILNRQKRFLASGMTFGEKTLQNQQEFERYQFIVEVDDKLDRLLNIQANKTVKSPNEKPHRKVYDALITQHLKGFISEVATAAKKKEENVVTTVQKNMNTIVNNKEAIDEIVNSFNDRLQQQGQNLTKPPPKSPFGTLSGGPPTEKEYEPHQTPFELKIDFEELPHKRPVIFKESLGIGGRHQVNMIVNLSNKMNHVLFKNKIKGVLGVSSARIAELLSFRVLDEENGLEGLENIWSEAVELLKKAV